MFALVGVPASAQEQPAAREQQQGVAQPTREELIEQLRQLQQRVEQLEAKQVEHDAAAQGRDVDGVMQRVIEDAERRSRLLMQDVSLTAGYDLQANSFFIRSADGNFLLIPGFLAQFRHVSAFAEDEVGDDEVESGFEVRRMRIIFTGNVFSPDWLYRFQWESNFDGGGVVLQDAFVRHRFTQDDRWSVQAGQFYDVPFHEQTMLDQFTLTADRSLINALIGGGQTDRVQGVMLMYDDVERWRAQAVVHDGYNSDNTPFTDAGGTALLGVTPTDWGASGRVEYFFSGARSAYEQFTALGTDQDLLVLGGGAGFSQSGDSDILFHSIDLQYENTAGLGAFAAVNGVWREIGDDAPVAAGNYYDWGFLVQASYLFTRQLEGFARYDVTFLDDELALAAEEDTIHEVTIGANYYFHRHNVKFTLDVNWLPNGVPVAVPALGYLASEDDEFVVRAQLQLFI